MSKTPYELREEVLELARTHVMDEYMSEREEWQAYADALRNYGQPVPNEHLTKFPKFPPLTKVLKVAEQFRSFVDNTSEKPITSTREDFNGLVETIKEAMPVKVQDPEPTRSTLLDPPIDNILRTIPFDRPSEIDHTYIYESNEVAADELGVFANRYDLAPYDLLLLQAEVNAGKITYEQACDPKFYPSESIVFDSAELIRVKSDKEIVTEAIESKKATKPVEVVVKKRRTTKAK